MNLSQKEISSKLKSLTYSLQTMQQVFSDRKSRNPNTSSNVSTFKELIFAILIQQHELFFQEIWLNTVMTNLCLLFFE